ncbi:trichohyalin-like [Trachinotus anak]|uniref:trichohyalin-like n=1 Tax=Trachinotus anak TaxID=443729 RepID=UPI0039F1FE60
MASSSEMPKNVMTTRQVTDKSQAQRMVAQELQHEIFNLNVLLGKERANCFREQNLRIQLFQELEQTKQQLAKQKSLKEMFINREKETRRELERLQKYTDPKTLSTAKIANQVQSDIKRKNKKLLQKDYEELQVAHRISQEKFTAELQWEMQKNKALQEELESLRASYQEISQRYEADVLRVREKADDLQHELEKEVKAHAETVRKDLRLERNLRAEQDALRKKMAEEISLVQQNAAEQEVILLTEVQELILLTEVQELKTQLNIQLSLNLQLSTELKAEREQKHPLQENTTSHESEENQEEEPEEEPAATQDTGPDKQEEAIPDILSDPEPEPTEIEVCEEILPSKPEKKSFWKRTCHFLGYCW